MHTCAYAHVHLVQAFCTHVYLPLCAFCICATAAMLANALALVACALFCTNFFCTFCICALAAISTYVLTLVSVTFALLCAYGICTLGCALAALIAYVLADVRSFRECDTGDSHLSAYCTVAEEERTSKVACSTVRSYDEIFASLTGSKCLFEIAASCALC